MQILHSLSKLPFEELWQDVVLIPPRTERECKKRKRSAVDGQRFLSPKTGPPNKKPCCLLGIFESEYRVSFEKTLCQLESLSLYKTHPQALHPLFSSQSQFLNQASETNSTVEESMYVEAPTWGLCNYQTAIPQSTLKHLMSSLYCKSTEAGSRGVIGKAIFNELSQNQGSLRSTLLPQNGPFRLPEGPLMRLPNELFDQIKEYLEPSDMVCLALTSRTLFSKFDYRLMDIVNCETSSYDLPTSEEHLTAYLVSQIYDVTSRLDRDTMVSVIAQEDEEFLACCACRTLHKVTLFSYEQRKSPAMGRVCTAADSPVKICDHFEAKLLQFRVARRNIQCNANFDYKGWVCDKSDGGQPKNYYWDHTGPCPAVHVSEGALRAVWSEELLSDTSNSFGDDLGGVIGKVDKSKRGRYVCSHISLTDDMIKRAFKRRLQDEWDHENQTCHACEAKWSFRVLEKQRRQRPPLQKLYMDIFISYRQLNNAWNKQWLHHIGRADLVSRYLDYTEEPTT
jgi:hypothetical protein